MVIHHPIFYDDIPTLKFYNSCNIRYQAPPLFLMQAEMIREPWDEASVSSRIQYSVYLPQNYVQDGACIEWIYDHIILSLLCHNSC